MSAPKPLPADDPQPALPKPAEQGQPSSEALFLEKRLLPGVRDVLAIDEDGMVAARLNQDAGRDLYLVDPHTLKAQLLAQRPEGEAEAAPAIWDARLSSTWAVWLGVADSKQRQHWSLTAHNRQTGQEIVLLREDAALRQKYPDLDTFPYFELSQDRLIWAYYEQQADGGVANVVKLRQLPNGEVRELARLTDAEVDIQLEYLSMPALYGQTAAWFRGRRDPSRVVLFADTYLYDLATGQTSALSVGTHASNPQLSDSHVVWLERSVEPKKIRSDIILYDRRTKRSVPINPADDAERFVGNWGLGISERFVVWWRNQPGIGFYDLRQGSLIPHSGCCPRLKGRYMTWVEEPPGKAVECWWARLDQ